MCEADKGGGIPVQAMVKQALRACGKPNKQSIPPTPAGLRNNSPLRAPFRVGRMVVFSHSCGCTTGYRCISLSGFCVDPFNTQYPTRNVQFPNTAAHCTVSQALRACGSLTGFLNGTKGETIRHASPLKPGDADGTDISEAMSVPPEAWRRGA